MLNRATRPGNPSDFTFDFVLALGVLDFVEVLDEGTFPTIDKLDSELTSNIFSIPSRTPINPHIQES